MAQIFAKDYFNIQDLKSDLKKHAIRGGGITVFSRGVIFIIQTISTVILARILSPEEFGLFVMVTAVVGFLTIFMDFGLTDAIIQKSEINHHEINNLFWINIAVVLIIITIAMILSPLIAWFYSEPRLIKITILWSSYLLFGALSSQHISLLKRRMQFLEISIIEIISIFISSIFAIIMALNGWSYYSLVFRQVFIGVSIAIGAWFVCKWRPGLPSRKTNVRPILLFGRNATGSFLMSYFVREI